MKFWDASAVMPLCLQESFSPVLTNILEQDELIIVWWATIVECNSALARVKREAKIDDISEERSRKLLGYLAKNWTEVQPGEQIRQSASRLLRVHDLRAADAFQLAAALIWTQGDPAEAEFVCLDQRLTKAARLEGFNTLPEAL